MSIGVGLFIPDSLEADERKDSERTDRTLSGFGVNDQRGQIGLNLLDRSGHQMLAERDCCHHVVAVGCGGKIADHECEIRRLRGRL